MEIIAITSGDPAGIGPEVIGKGLRFYPLNHNVAYVIYGELLIPPGYKLVKKTSDLTGTFRDRNSIISIDNIEQITQSGLIYNIDISSDDIVKGKPTSLSGKIALNILDKCIQDIKNQNIKTLLTAPVCKEMIRLHESEFIGHTEYLAKKFDCSNYVMNFVGEDFSMALLTTHCPLNKVMDSITSEYLLPKFRLINQYAINNHNNCRIALLSMNPHSGEGGIFGKEDSVLREIIEELKAEGVHIEGPFPADSFFKYKLSDYRQIIAIYHDQGLIPFKLLNGNSGVNMTLGLPITRTSVDHGTAFDIASKNIASPESFISALKTAERSIGQAINNDHFSSYKSFSHYYDHYMNHVDWNEWVLLIETVYNKFLDNNDPQVLDIGCGTAQIANILADKGYQIEAIDISPEMLTEAAKKNTNINLFQGSFKSSLPTKSYDLIISLFDCINYIYEMEEVESFFRKVSDSLKNRGLFIFDISTKLNCENNYDGYVYVDETDNSFLTVRSNYKDSYQFLDLNLFTKNSFLWTSDEEHHKLKIHSTRDLIKIISQISGFELKGLYRLEGLEQLSSEYIDLIDSNVERVFFTVQKIQ